MSVDALVEASKRVWQRLEPLLDRSGQAVVLIDGHAGSGKSTFAKLLVDEVFRAREQAPHLIHMDDLYPGWEGLRAGSLYLQSQVLDPLSMNKNAHWQIWDWDKGLRGGADPGNGWREYDGRNLLIVEGCGSISQSTAPLADLKIWIEAPEELRKERFLSRDNGQFAKFYDLWTMQEHEFYEAEQSKSLADTVIQN